MDIQKKSNKKIILLAVTMIIVFIIAGCSGNNSGGNSGKQSTSTGTETKDNGGTGKQQDNDGKKKKISILNNTFATEPMRKDDPYFLELQELTGFEIEMNWVPASAYNDRLTAAMAGGKLADAFKANHLTPAVYNALQTGMFWEIGPYLEDYPYLSQLNPDILSNTMVDGKIYGLFRSRPISRDGIIYRKDWLDNIGRTIPDTYEEMIDLVYALHEEDPNQSGKKDTYAFNGGLGDLKTFMLFHGVAQRWHIEDGKITAWFLTEPFKEVLHLFRQFYVDGVIPKDFIMLEDKKAEFNKGKIGLVFGALDDIDKQFDEVANLFPESELGMSQYPKGPDDVRRAKATQGYNEVFLIPKTEVKTEERVKEILEYFDKMWSPEVQNLMNWGIEGVNYEIKDDHAIVIDSVLGKNSEDLFQLKLDDGKQALPGDPDALNSEVSALQTESEAFAVLDPTLGTISSTYNEKGKQLEQMVEDAIVQFVMGEIDEAGVDQVLTRWKEQGGTQILEEYENARK